MNWKNYADKIQLSYLPATLACIGMFVVLGATRDIVFADFQPPLWNLVLNCAAIAIFTATTLLLVTKKLKPPHAQFFLLLCYIFICVRPSVIAFVDDTPATLVIASVIFATGILFLSLPFLFVAQAIALSVWMAVVYEDIAMPQYSTTLLVALLACGLGYWLQQTRIKQHLHNYELETRVENLETILPMCANCKNTRDDDGKWMSVELYIEANESAQISHAMCPDCKEELYGDYLRDSAARRAGVSSANSASLS